MKCVENAKRDLSFADVKASNGVKAIFSIFLASDFPIEFYSRESAFENAVYKHRHIFQFFLSFPKVSSSFRYEKVLKEDSSLEFERSYFVRKMAKDRFSILKYFLNILRILLSIRIAQTHTNHTPTISRCMQRLDKKQDWTFDVQHL